MAMHEITRSDEEIDRVLNWAAEGRSQGGRYPGMSYEDGIINMLDWLTGMEDIAPDQK